MPYAPYKNSKGKWDVKKKGPNGPEGESLGEHSSRPSAINQIRAIYAHEGKAGKETGAKYYDDMGSMTVSPNPFIEKTDPRSNYSPLGGDKSYACANCAFFNVVQSSCQLVIGDISPTGYCDLWTRELTEDESDAARAMPMYMVEKSIKERVVEALQDFFGGGKVGSTVGGEIKASTGFKTFGDNNRYWVAFWSNNARDRDGEWFAEKAHDRYIARLDAGIVPYPELWYWHEIALKCGKAFCVDRIDHVMFAVGEFDDTPVAHHMKAYLSTSTDDQVSHGYLFPPSARIDHVYWDYNTFEISPLPAVVASNPFTEFVPVEELKAMSLSKEKQAALEARLGKDFVAQLLQVGETKSKEIEAVTTSFKAGLENPLEAQVKALETKFDKVLDALATLSQKQKKGAEGSPEEEASESDTEAASEGDKPKKKKEVATPPPVTIPPEMIALLQNMTKEMATQRETLKAISEQFANPIPASRSQYTVVPPTDPALEKLKEMNETVTGDKMASPTAPTNAQGMTGAQMMDLFYPGIGVFGQNGNKP